MANQTIAMTQAQTETYDDGGEAAERIMRDLRSEARELHEETGAVVEIHTADGIVAGVVQ